MNGPLALKARPTVYRGIHMRSRLEARAASQLDQHTLQWRYEPHCFGDERGQYLPDFMVSTVPRGMSADDTCPVCRPYAVRYWVEVKPRWVMQDSVALMRARARMLIVRSSLPDARLCLWFPEADHVVFSPRPNRWCVAPASYALRDMTAYKLRLRACAGSNRSLKEAS